jgi:hypothetical protein
MCVLAEVNLIRLFSSRQVKNFILLKLKKKDSIFHSTSEITERRNLFGGEERWEVETF